MMSLIYSVLGFLVAISVLVAVHEFGHYYAARRLGVKVLKFSIGFGRPLWAWTGGEDQTEYRISAIPLGGYVQMLGENDPNVELDAQDKARSFDAQSIWKRSVIAAAGPAINFAFAVLLFFALALANERQFAPVFGDLPDTTALGQQGVQPGDRLLAVDGQRVAFMSEYSLYVFNQVLKQQPIEFLIDREGQTQTVVVPTESMMLYDINPGTTLRQVGLFPKVTPVSSELGLIVPDSPAAAAGLQVGDRVVAIDGVVTLTWSQMTAAIVESSNEILNFEVEREGVVLSMPIQPRIETSDGVTRRIIGVGRTQGADQSEHLVTISRSLTESVAYGVQQTWLISELTVRMLGKMLTLQVSPKNVNGPITIADVAGQTLQIDWQAYVHFLAVISISLGIMNLLPIPMLDGGHLLTYAVEAVFGRPVSEAFYAVGQRLGIVLLVGLMSLAFYNDIFRILN